MHQWSWAAGSSLLETCSIARHHNPYQKFKFKPTKRNQIRISEGFVRWTSGVIGHPTQMPNSGSAAGQLGLTPMMEESQSHQR